MQAGTDRRVLVPERVRILSTTHGWRMVRFGVVGGLGVVVNMSILYVLAAWVGMRPLAAAVVATEASIATNFVLNDVWTFRDARHNARWHKRFGRYNLFAGGGLVLSITTLAAVTYTLKLHYLVGNLIAISVATVWNYLANARWTWAVSRAQAERAAEETP